MKGQFFGREECFGQDGEARGDSERDRETETDRETATQRQRPRRRDRDAEKETQRQRLRDSDRHPTASLCEFASSLLAFGNVVFRLDTERPPCAVAHTTIWERLRFETPSIPFEYART